MLTPPERYQLVRRISGGGMGEVYLARWREGAIDKEVALKLLLPDLATAADPLERFMREARLAARMHHPNIVEVFDAGELHGRPFIAMQLVDGITLEQLLESIADPLPLPIVRLIATGLLEALDYAHTLSDERGELLRVVHRDVTPGNVLISRAGTVLLTDFGIAREGNVVRTAPGVLRGKPAFLSPEQLRQHPVDLRTDLFSAALCLYEAATLAHPFRRATPDETLAAIERDPAADPRVHRASLTEPMATALLRALEKDPRARFGSARAFRHAFIDGPVATSPELAALVSPHCRSVTQRSPAGAGTLSAPGRGRPNSGWLWWLAAALLSGGALALGLRWL